MDQTKRILRCLLCLLLAILLLPAPVPASNESPQPLLPFQDVLPGIWFYESVQVVCTLGLMQGTSADTFSPSGTVPLSHGIVAAVRLYEWHYGAPEEGEKPGGPWYTYYVQKALAYGLLPETLQNEDMQRPVTRAELCGILYRALPQDTYTPINPVERVGDYADWEPYWGAVLAMYRSGILLGDEDFCVRPFQKVRRSELAVLLARMVCPEYRVAQEHAAPHRLTGMNAFRLPEELPQIPFGDVRGSNWFYDPVRYAYALGLVNGVSPTSFYPGGTVTLGQAAAVAVRVYESYYALEDHAGEYPGKWYDYYMYMAQYYGLLPATLLGEDPRRNATRAELAAIIYGTLPQYPVLRKVKSIPDYGQGELYWHQVHTLYEAGILSGVDAYGTFRPDSDLRRSELAAVLAALVVPSLRKATALVLPPLMEKLVYGTSGGGRELVAYRYGSGKNVLILTFALHGFEDCYNKDGQLLVDTAHALRKKLEEEYDTLVRSRDWSVYVIPCANPDGLAEGWTNNGPGRCTVYSYDAGGNLQRKGIDLNRSFPFNWSSATGGRNYNGHAPLQAPEAQALASFTQKVKGSGYNVLIDAHGWLQNTMVKGTRDCTLARLFRQYFPENGHITFTHAPGYYSAWAGYMLGYDACLFEFPDISGYNDFNNRSCKARFIRTITDLLLNYSGPVS